ncbi:hypothetical protein JCM15519_30520 [Fundidesulfovibrio butyratiphilus]
MTSPWTRPEAGQRALSALGTLNRLILEAGQSQDRTELTFRLLNRTITLTRYDRACLFGLEGAKPVLLGVSGQSRRPKDSELAEQWTDILAGLPGLDQARILTGQSLASDQAQAWSALSARTAGLCVVWLPLFSRGRLAAGLWLERWAQAPWLDMELELLVPLAQGYSIAWEKCAPRFDARKWIGTLTQKRRVAAALVVALIVLCLPVSLRVVAPCEVTAKDPFVVTAPLNGVIAEVKVQPGQKVDTGEPLFVYDKRVAVEDLKVARQQVQIIQSSLTRSNLQAFLDTKAKGEMALLELRLEQEKSRLELAESNVAKLEVTAEIPGVVVIDDPNEWRGRPVAVGEKVLMIVDPARTKLRVWLPVDDNVPFDPDKPVHVYLNAFPEADIQARLTHVARNVGVSPQGFPCVMAECEWTKGSPPLRIGLQGTAVIRGHRVALAYWLLRKPLAWMRRTLGL